MDSARYLILQFAWKENLVRTRKMLAEHSNLKSFDIAVRIERKLRRELKNACKHHDPDQFLLSWSVLVSAF